MDAGEQADEIVLSAQREHRVDQFWRTPASRCWTLRRVGKKCITTIFQ